MLLAQSLAGERPHGLGLLVSHVRTQAQGIRPATDERKLDLAEEQRISLINAQPGS